MASTCGAHDIIACIGVIEPIGFSVPYGEFVPELLRVAVQQLVDAGRVEEPVAAPDVEALRKALEWPIERAPKTTAAAVKRVEAALAAASTGDAGAASRSTELAVLHAENDSEPAAWRVRIAPRCVPGYAGEMWGFSCKNARRAPACYGPKKEVVAKCLNAQLQ